MPAPLDLDGVDAIRELEAICESNEAREVRLPSGRLAVVVPMDGLAELAEALEDPEFQRMLKASAAEFEAGALEPM